MLKLLALVLFSCALNAQIFPVRAPRWYSSTTAPSGGCAADADTDKIYIHKQGSATTDYRCRKTGASTFAWQDIATASVTGLTDPGSNGVVARTGAGTTAARTITAGTGITVNNGDGVAANPTISADTSVLLTKAASQAGAHLAGTTGGTSTAYTLALTPTLTEYTDGMVLTVKFHTAAGASAQLSVNDLGLKDLWTWRSDGALARLPSSFAAGIRSVIYNAALTDVSTGGFIVDQRSAPTAGVGINESCSGGACTWSPDLQFSLISTGTNTTATTTWGSGSSLVAGSATRTAPNKSGTALPATCTVGDSYQKTDASAASQHYLCTSANTWTAQGGGAPNSLFDTYSTISGTTCNSSNNGQVALLTASNYSSARCNGSAWEYVVAGFGVKASVPDPANYTLVTSMSGTKDTSTGGGIYYHQDTTAGGGGNYVYGAMLKAVPATPYTITGHMRQIIQSDTIAFNFMGCGFAWTNGTATSSKIQIGFMLGSASSSHKSSVAVRHANDYADTSGAWDVDGDTYPAWGTTMLEWFQLADTGSTKTIKISTNGVDWRTVYSASSSTNFTPTHYGPACYQGSQPAMWQVNVTSILEQ